MLEYRVLDAGAIIKGHGMNLFIDSNVIVTVPEVIAEIRDSKSRDLLSRLPFELEERAPSAESLRTGRVAPSPPSTYRLLIQTSLSSVTRGG